MPSIPALIQPSVIFDAIQAAKARNIDVLIADTAGRLQNKSHLMEELKKIVRVMKKLDVDAPHEVMLTIDASTGQNAISQAKLFHEAVGLTGITLTKLTEPRRAGLSSQWLTSSVFPIRYIGVGERIEDLRPFNAGDFIEALFCPRGLRMIRFEQVSKAYLGGRQALGVTFHLQQGEMAFLTGHSGAGKSTLLKLICGIERPSAGENLFFSGHDISRLKSREVPFLAAKSA